MVSVVRRLECPERNTMGVETQKTKHDNQNGTRNLMGSHCELGGRMDGATNRPRIQDFITSLAPVKLLCKPGISEGSLSLIFAR